MLDLKRFSEETEEIVPIIGGTGRFHGRFISLKVDDGWYLVSLGDKALIKRKATVLEVAKAIKDQPTFSVYALGIEGIPLSFDSFSRRGWGEAVTVNFQNLQIFEVARIVYWEDKRFYFYGQEMPNEILREAKKVFEKNEPFNNIKGLTPELRYYLILVSLQRESFRAAQELAKFKLNAAERAKRIKEFQETFSGRLQRTIENVGGTLIRYSKKGNNYNVRWKVYGQEIVSTIKDDERIISLGFCASGADTKHTLSSAIALAKLYYEEAGTDHGGLYITRS